jgi:hypothetical protein
MDIDRFQTIGGEGAYARSLGVQRQPRSPNGGLRHSGWLALLALLAGATAPAGAQEAADFFKQNCASCHTIGGGPEETTYFVLRERGAWQPLLVADLVLNWAIPFVVLLPRAAKRSPGVLAKVCVLVVLGRWLDLYFMIAPAVDGPVPAFGLLEVGLTVGAAGLFGLAFFRSLSRAALVPLRDPFLVESLCLAGGGHHPGSVAPRLEHVQVGVDHENGARHGAETPATSLG